MKHFLTSLAFVYDPAANRDDDLTDCRYDETFGAWFWRDTDEVLVMSNNPDRPRPQTKKQDQETGEDQKGE